jgi:hypothetical protein
MIIDKNWHSLCAERLESVIAAVDPTDFLSSCDHLSLWEYEESDFKQFICLARKYKSYEACGLIEESFERWKAGDSQDDPLLSRGPN